MSFDLSGLLQLQSVYLSNILNSSDLTTQFSSLQTQLDNINKQYGNISNNSNGLLSQQNTLNNILNDERRRLERKQSEIDIKDFETKRIVSLNDSYRKKQAQYVYIIIVFVFALVFYIILIKIKQFFPVVPDSIIDFSTIVLVGVTCIYVYTLVMSIYSRDNTNFDELNLPAPTTVTSTDTIAAQAAAAKSGDLLAITGNPNNCVGQDCCVPNVTDWETGILKCIPLVSSLGSGKVYQTDQNGTVLTANIDIGTCQSQGKQVCGHVCIPKTQACYTSPIESFVSLGSNVQPYAPSQYDNYSPLIGK